jgi:hypothetical protein
MITLFLTLLSRRADPIPAIPGIDWAPPVDLATSAIIAQALRYMRLPPISMFDPSNPILPALRDAFDLAMDEALGAADWSFASVLAVLAPAGLPIADIADDAMPYAFQAPADAIMLRRVGNAGTAWRMDRGLLRADQPGPLTVRYTARITIEAHLPATFRTAVAMQIAAGLGGQYAGATIAADDLALQAAQTLKQAMREDARHAAAERVFAPANLGYGPDDCHDDWAMVARA